MKLIIYYCILSCAIVFSSCNWSLSKKNEELALVETQSIEVTVNLEKIKKIFYVLPTPEEISFLIKNSGARYRSDLLNPSANLIKYSTSGERAINLGVYCSDLSYLSFFEQFASSREYIRLSKNLAESLGITNVVDSDKIKKMETELNNKDLILELSSDIYLETSEQFKEQERYSAVSLMLVGSWVESMYIATQLTDIYNVEHVDLISRIADQKLSMISVINVLDENKSEPRVATLYKEFVDLHALFSKLIISKGSVVLKEDKKLYVELLDNRLLDAKRYDDIVLKIEKIRNSLIE